MKTNYCACVLVLLFGAIQTAASEGAYDFKIVAQTSQSSLTGIKGGVSINDSGTVAFVGAVSGGESIFVGDGNRDPVNITPSLKSGYVFSTSAQINNAGWVVGQDRKGSSYAIRVWN